MNRLGRILTFDLPGSPQFWSEFHKWATIMWMLLMIPSLLWWGEILKWIVVMSVWANIAGHWSSYQAAEAQLETQKKNN